MTLEPTNDEKERQWRDALEELGPENVRLRLAQTDTGSILSGYGDLKKRYAERWLAEKDRGEVKRRERWNWATIIVALVAAVAAIVAAWPVVQSWF